MNIKVTPHSEESEIGVLGSILLDPESIDRIDLNPEAFYSQRNRLLYEEIRAMRSDIAHIDAITIGEWLKKRGTLEKVGGYDRLVELQKDTIVSAHIQSYAENVNRTWRMRRIIEIASDGIDMAYKDENASDRIISSLMAMEKEERHTVAGIIDVWEKARNGEIQTMPTPCPDLDRMTGGIRMGVPTVLTGRSKAGKSMFLAWWYNILGQQGFPVVVFPFEDNYNITITRMAANLGKYKWSRIENGGEWVYKNGVRSWDRVGSDEIRKAKRCLEEVSSYPIHFHEQSMYPDELLGKVAYYKRKFCVRGFFIDGAKDFIKPSGKYNDVGFDEECSQIIKRACKQHDVAGVVVHHLVKIDDSEVISSHHVRGSGNIIGDSRSVYALQSKGIEKMGVVANTDDYGRLTTRVFHCIENNHGGSGYVVLESDLSKCQFWEQ